MAVDDTTETTEDTGLSDEVDTSVDDGKDLEEDDTSFEDLPDEDDEETAATETEESDEAEDKDEEESTDTEEDDDAEESIEDEAKEEPEVEEDKPDEEERKRQNDEYARKRIADREEKEKAKADSQSKYLEDAEDDRDLALRQLQVNAYNNQVENNRNKLQTSVDRAVAGIDLFTTGTPEAKEELVAAVEEFERANVRYDTNGDPIQINGDLYEHLTKKANSIRRLMESGARTAKTSQSKTKARTIPVPSKKPKEPTVDPDLAAFDDEVAKYF